MARMPATAIDHLGSGGQISVDLSDMRSRLTLHTFPARVAAMLLALLAAFAVGDCVGYALKPNEIAPRTTRAAELPVADTLRGAFGYIWIGQTLYTQGGPGQPWQKHTSPETIPGSSAR
jgi:hypothetical protein